MKQLSMDLRQRECFRGAVFTMEVRELQNSSWLLANHLKSNSLSCGIYIPRQQGCSAWTPKGGKPSLQDDLMRLSLYIYGHYVMEHLRNSGYSMIRLP